MSFKYIRITVPYYIPIAVLGLVAGAVLTTGALPDFRIVYAAISLAFLVGGFNTFNGVYDKQIDVINKPRRPIANGKISEKAGIVYAFFLYIISFAFAFLINPYFIGIIGISIVLTISYSIPPIRLRARFIINTLTGLIFYGFLCPLAGWALYPSYGIPIELIVFIFLLGSGIAITKDFEDVEGDKTYDIKTLPLVMGFTKAKVLVGALIFFSFAYIVSISLSQFIDMRYLSILIFIPWAAYIVYSLGENSPKGYSYNENKKTNKTFFIKNMFLAISVELFLIVITLI
jgi:4-hydroxybenzoate polyprenyltransferase